RKDDRRNDALAIVELLDQAQAIRILVDVHERIRDAVLAEELLGLFAILAPRRTVQTDRPVYGHIGFHSALQPASLRSCSRAGAATNRATRLRYAASG